MAAKKEFTIELSLGSPRCLLFFDRFAVHKSADFTDLTFGNSRATSVCVRILNEVLDANRDNFLKYLQESGSTTTARPDRMPSGMAEELLFADIIGLARHGALGEIMLHAFSWKLAVERARNPGVEDSSVPSICVGFLRSDIETQRHWIATLYGS